ncbi:hypothetical protein J3U18_06170 [Gilliamella sp. B3482]|uniref:hypothetical protein n=1 Tax=unclassified Gilliamella TaxID=2685620 RepID=UPI00226AA7D2|nr:MULTISPECIES: hypothetical protein [unclassified Gilliamella]MCX8581273.1 hypothetical protein [Gilliamella sp. B3482]MCX8682231.1 hypothetical protein [Gilliamella sp. B2889]
MATFDEKEFLWEEMYNSVRICISKAKGYGNEYTSDMLEDIKKLREFRKKIADTSYEEIDYEAALKFFQLIENKYK